MYGSTLVVPTVPTLDRNLFALVDWRTAVVLGSAPAGAAGTITATSDTPPDDEWWLIERLIVNSTSTTATSVDLYVGQADPHYERDWTPQGGSTGNHGVAEYPRGLLCEPSQPCIIVWSGASLAATAFYNMQIQVYKRVQGD